MSGPVYVSRYTSKPFVFRSTIDEKWYAFVSAPGDDRDPDDPRQHLRHDSGTTVAGFKEGPFANWQGAFKHALRSTAWHNDFHNNAP